MSDVLSLPWPDFLQAIKNLPEEECWSLLAMERSGKSRMQVLQRLYGRANKLRAQRELREWLGA